MRYLKIISAVTIIIALSFGISYAQQSLQLFQLMKPETLQRTHNEIVNSFDAIGYQKISIQLKPPAKVIFEFDKIGRMQSLVNSSV